MTEILFARLDDVDASGAIAARDAAIVARNEAREARDEAEAAQSLAEQARDAAQLAQSEAESAQAGSEQARDNALAAQQGAETAQGLAEAARDAAVVAQGAAQNAQAAAEFAQAAAEQAQGGAEDAQVAAEAARDAAQAAQLAAEAAQAAAEAAQGAAEAAQGLAEAARDAAQLAQVAAETAQGDAEQARDAAQAAQTGAENAEAGAEAARDKAEAWAQSPEDDPVETGPDQFSALHWAAKAEAFALSIDPSQFVPTSRQINTSGGIDGGGDLTADRTLSLSTTVQASLSLADTAVQPGDQIVAPASTSSAPGLIITPGVGLSAPNNGDVWAVGANLQYQLGGAPRVVVNTNQTQTLSNKTLASPFVTGIATFQFVSGDKIQLRGNTNGIGAFGEVQVSWGSGHDWRIGGTAYNDPAGNVRMSLRNTSFTVDVPINGVTLSGVGSLERSGAHDLTLTTTGNTDVTLPTSGTLATNAVFAQDTDGLVPGPSASDIAANRVLQADGAWVDQTGGGGSDNGPVVVGRDIRSSPRGIYLADGFAASFGAGTQSLDPASVDYHVSAFEGAIDNLTFDEELSLALDTNSAGWADHTIRQWFAAALFSGPATHIRVTLEASSQIDGVGATILDAHVGHGQSGNPSYSGTPVELTALSDSFGMSLAYGASDTMVSDKVPFAYDGTSPLLVAFYVSAGDLEEINGLGGNYVPYYKNGVNEAATTGTVSGYSTWTASSLGVRKIELFSLKETQIVLAPRELPFVPATATAAIRARLNGGTINTDIVVEISRDGGTTWTTATMSALRTVEDGYTIYQSNTVNISGQPSGDDITARVTYSNDFLMEVSEIEVRGAV